MAPAMPAELGKRAADLWSAVVANGTPDPAGAVLLEEACRCIDRLDELHGRRRNPAALVEARQQQLVLTKLLTRLGLGHIDTRVEGRTLADELAARRASRGRPDSAPAEPSAGQP